MIAAKARAILNRIRSKPFICQSEADIETALEANSRIGVKTTRGSEPNHRRL
jgi:hypothetical protein